MKTSMYNHRQNVFEVQTALRALWSAENTDTRINPDGNYGDIHLPPLMIWALIQAISITSANSAVGVKVLRPII